MLVVHSDRGQSLHRYQKNVYDSRSMDWQLRPTVTHSPPVHPRWVSSSRRQPSRESAALWACLGLKQLQLKSEAGRHVRPAPAFRLPGRA